MTQKTRALRRALGTAAVALVGLLALPQAAEAQSRDGRGDGDRVERRVAQLDEALDLSDRQASQLRALFEAQEADRPARGERRSGSPEDREAMRAEREARRAEMDRQIADVLTPAQLERYQALREARPSERGGGRRGDGR